MATVSFGRKACFHSTNCTCVCVCVCFLTRASFGAVDVSSRGNTVPTALVFRVSAVSLWRSTCIDSNCR